MNRWKASGTHLLLSFLVIGLIAAYIIYFWYPPALMKMAKADELLLIIGSIDLAAGPLLTLIVYKANKPSLKFDLAVIALMQLGFLSYGLHTIYESRPVFMVAVRDRFEMVFANEVEPENLAKAAMPNTKTLGFTAPKLVGAKQPASNDLRMLITMKAMDGGNDIQALPEFYVPYEKMQRELLGYAMPITTGPDTTEENSQYLLQAAKSYGRTPDEVRYVPISSLRGFAAMLLDAKTGAIVGPVRQNL